MPRVPVRFPSHEPEETGPQVRPSSGGQTPLCVYKVLAVWLNRAIPLTYMDSDGSGGLGFGRGELVGDGGGRVTDT